MAPPFMSCGPSLLFTARCSYANRTFRPVDTDHGTYVLDNRYEKVMPWQGLGYTWIKAQSDKPGDKGWVTIG